MTSIEQSSTPIAVKKIEIQKKSLPLARGSSEAPLKSRKVFSLTPELLKDKTKTSEAIAIVNAKHQNFFAEESQDLMNSAVQHYLRLPDKGELWSDLENVLSPGNQAKGTCLPSDAEKDLTESVGSPKENRKRVLLNLKVKRKSSEEGTASPELKVLMRRGEKDTNFSLFNLEEDDTKKLDQDGDKINSRPDESVASNRILSQFAVNNVKKPTPVVGESTLNEQLNEMKNLSAINLRKVTPLQRSDTQKSLATKKNWNKLSHVFQSVVFLQHEEAKEVKDAELISDEINEFRLRKITTIRRGGQKGKMNITKDDMTREAFDMMRTIRIFCECAATGGQKHVQLMSHMIKSDPRKFMFDQEDPNHLLNRPNNSGHRPLYIAAKHGNFEVVKLLIENKANHLLTSQVSDSSKTEETALEVAVRWGHLQVTEYLLKNCMFNSITTQKCFNMTKNDSMRVLLKHCSRSKESRKSFFSFLGCFKTE